MAKRGEKPPPIDPDQPLPTKLRIIGGNWRGRTIEYSGDLRTRPMKDRVREALFNLVGTDAIGAHVIDLFAGTGAIGLEGLSRGAVSATFLERHLPTAKLITANAITLGAADQVEVLSTNTFIWARRHAPLPTDRHWLVLCSPPYDFYVDRRDEMLALIGQLWNEAPVGSVFVLEYDERYDFTGLPPEAQWDVRTYPPATLAIAQKGDGIAAE